MARVVATHYIVRLLEERLGPPVSSGDVLVARPESRLPWIDPVFTVEPGQKFRVNDIHYSEAGPPDHDPFDGHYHYAISGLEDHGRISTTELVALFELVDQPNLFQNLCNQLRQLLEDRA